MDRCKKRLAIIWLIGSSFLLFILIIQSTMGFYGKKTEEAWAWLLSNVLPTASLIAGVMASDKLGRSRTVKQIDSFVYRLALLSSVFYLVIASLTIFIRPYTQWSQLELMKLSNLWLAPSQAIVAAFIGAFFVRKEAK